MLINALKNTDNSLTKSEIIKTLGKIGTTKAIDAIKKILDHDDWKLKWIAKETLDLIQ